MSKDNNITIVSCSGASNTGCFTDTVARKLAESGQANMLCLAKIAIGDEQLIESTKSSNDKIIVLDGCPFNCAEKILKREGIDRFHHVNTTDFGITKGKTPVTDEKVNEIIDYIKQL